jgi:hypothetical protein
MPAGGELRLEKTSRFAEVCFCGRHWGKADMPTASASDPKQTFA